MLVNNKQFLNLITYEGPLSEEDNLQPLRKSPQAKFMRGLMSEVIQTALDYIEKNQTHGSIIHCMFMMLREILTRLSAEFKERGLIVTRLTQGPKYSYVMLCFIVLPINV